MRLVSTSTALRARVVRACRRESADPNRYRAPMGHERPVRVVALNADEGWARDVSENIAAKIREVAQREGQDLTSGTRAFIEAHSQRTIPTFW